MRKTLDEIMLDFDAIHCRFESKPYLYKWLFTYACETIEYQGGKPTEFPTYVNWLMRSKATDFYNIGLKAYWKGSTRTKIKLIDIDLIPKVVASEHRKSK